MTTSPPGPTNPSITPLKLMRSVSMGRCDSKSLYWLIALFKARLYREFGISRPRQRLQRLHFNDFINSDYMIPPPISSKQEIYVANTSIRFIFANTISIRRLCLWKFLNVKLAVTMIKLMTLPGVVMLTHLPGTHQTRFQRVCTPVC